MLGENTAKIAENVALNCHDFNHFAGNRRL